MRLFSVGKKIIDKYPSTIKLASFCYNFLSCNFVKGRKGNKIFKNNAFLSHCKIKIKGKGNKIFFGEKAFLKKCKIVINGNNNVVNISDLACLHKADIVMEDDNNTITIGRKTLICGPCHIAAIEGTKVNIGEDCLFSSEIHIRTGDSHSVIDVEGNRINPSSDIKIGNRVWLGFRVLLLKGAEIANDTVVSAGAIVTKKIEETNVVLAGIPAKVVKNGIKWDKNRIITKTK